MSLIKSYSVENGDMFYIVHGSNNFTMIDCNLVGDQTDSILDELAALSKEKAITRFISTHPDEDHIHGLERIDDRLGLLNFYCVKNKATKPDSTDSFERYCQLRDSDKSFFLEKGCSRRWMNLNDDEKNYGASGISVLWPVTSNYDFREELEKASEGLSPNNISPVIRYTLKDGVRAIWMGDLESSFMEKIEDEIEIGKADILFAPHHGRSSGRPPKSWMDSMDPGLVVIGEADSEVLDYYQGYTHICQNTAGTMLFECESGYVHVYAENPCIVKGLLTLDIQGRDGMKYIGSLKTAS